MDGRYFNIRQDHILDYRSSFTAETVMENDKVAAEWLNAPMLTLYRSAPESLLWIGFQFAFRIFDFNFIDCDAFKSASTIEPQPSLSDRDVCDAVGGPTSGWPS